jgi:hypothetical protein
MIRCLRILLSIIAVVIALGLNLPKVRAEGYRHHQAHEHGVAHMNVAVEGNYLYIEFVSPAANIVGFEHHPRTQEQKAAVQQAIETLKADKKLFGLPPDAGSRLAQSKAVTDIVDDSGNESESEHTHEHGEAHEKARKDKNNSKEEHDAVEPEHERHSEFTAEYRFVLKKPEKLKHIDVMLFRIFPGIEHIEVQLLTGTKQTALELTAKKNKIVF